MFAKYPTPRYRDRREQKRQYAKHLTHRGGKKRRRLLMIGGAALIIALGAAAWYANARLRGEATPIDSVVDAVTNESTIRASENARKLPSVVSVAQSLSGVSQFNNLFRSTGVIDAITGTGPYTIFVPTNRAFNQLPAGTISGLTPSQKFRFIQYHIVAGRTVDADAQRGTVQTLAGDALNFTRGPDDNPMVNSAIFLEKHEASNGVVYLIDTVLLPPRR